MVKQIACRFSKVNLWKLTNKQKRKTRHFVGQTHLDSTNGSHFEQVKGHMHKFCKNERIKIVNICHLAAYYSGSWPNVKADDLLFSTQRHHFLTVKLSNLFIMSASFDQKLENINKCLENLRLENYKAATSDLYPVSKSTSHLGNARWVVAIKSANG